MLHDLNRDATHMALGALRLLRPYTVRGKEKIRIGRFFDGGYIMIDKFEGLEAAYSLGINDDVSWDVDIANRGIEIFQFDPTIESLPEEHPLFNWKSVWIGGETNVEENTDTLESLILQNGHLGNRNLLLKCDIEGAEWPMLQKTPNHILDQFRQMVFEIHSLDFLADFGHANNVRKALLNLTASHHVVHVHANNYGGWHVIGGIPVPAVLELTLLRKDEGEFDLSDEIFPTVLDMPCNAMAADLYLGRFAY